MITIVGAGLVGSLWALLLRRQGHEVSLYERRADPRRQTTDAGRSINLVVTSRGLNALALAGLQEKVRALAVPVYGRMIHPVQGECLYQAYGQKNEYNLSISRGELNKFLIDEAEKAGAKIYFEHEFEDIEPQTKKIKFKTPRGPADTDYEVLFGADGSGSRLRKRLAQIYGFKEETHWLEADYKELTLPLGPQGEPQLKAQALHIWPRGAHMMMALANRDGSFTSTLYLPKNATPVRPWAFDRIQSDGDVDKLFRSEFPDAIELMPQYLQEFRAHPQGHLGTVRCERWVFNDSIALMGDAAHAIVPFFGQGMNSGFEDCTALADLCRKHDGKWAQILKTYEQMQKPNANAIADMALENWVEMKDKVGDAKFLLRKKIESVLEQKYPGRFKSRYGLITYTLTPYALAQEAGLCQGRILDQLTGEASSLEQVSWERADQLLAQEWFPFLERRGLQIKNYEG